MSDSFSETRPDARGNAAEFTVSEISSALRRTVEDAFGNVRVRGEISGYRGPHSSGHAYFSLKDDRSRLEAVIWKMTFSRLRFKPEEGMEVIASGKLTTYPGSSKYQIVIDNLEPAGAGALMALLEERKRRLQAEGLFEAARKRPLPYMPRVIGVVTSPTGAVIRDIIHRIKDRFPLHVVVWPVRVQGETCGAEVTAAVAGFNALPGDGALRRPDVLIVARGGGSLEDLWGFNDEALARAVAASAIPVISAVGHETDWTLVDFVSDRRAPTPTGAAEMAVPVRAELEAMLAGFGARLKACTSRHIDRKRQAVRAAARALPSPDSLLALPRRRLDEAGSRLQRALVTGTERQRARLDAVKLAPATLSRRIGEGGRRVERDLGRAAAALRALIRTRRAELERQGGQLPRCARAVLRHRRQDLAASAARLSLEPVARRGRAGGERLGLLGKRFDHAASVRLDRLRRRLTQADRLLSTLSHRSILERGFVLVSDAEGRLLKRAAEIAEGAALTLQFADGRVGATANGQAEAPAGEPPRPKPAQKPARPPRGEPGGQGSLF